MSGMNGSATPLWEQLAIVLIGPLVMASIWWLISRGWATNVQEKTVSARTKRRQKIEFWVLIALMYATTIGMLLYALFRRKLT